MTIDWTNPSDDVVEAKRVGYLEGTAEQECQIKDLEDRIAELEGKLAASEKDNQALLADMSQPHLLLARYKNEGMAKYCTEHWAMRLLALNLGETLKGLGAKAFVTIDFDVPEVGSVSVTVQINGRTTPAELLARVKTGYDAFRGELLGYVNVFRCEAGKTVDAEVRKAWTDRADSIDAIVEFHDKKLGNVGSLKEDVAKEA